MMDDRDTEVSHEVHSFVSELRRLADALESGAVFTIHIDGEDVTIPEGALLSVAHEREDGEVELEFQITWSLPGAKQDDEDENEDEVGETHEDTTVPDAAEATDAEVKPSETALV